MPSAAPTLLPWLSSLQQLGHLHLEMRPQRKDGDFDLKEGGQLLMKHISCLYQLTHKAGKAGASSPPLRHTDMQAPVRSRVLYYDFKQRQPTADPRFSDLSVRLQLFLLLPPTLQTSFLSCRASEFTCRC